MEPLDRVYRIHLNQWSYILSHDSDQVELLPWLRRLDPLGNGSAGALGGLWGGWGPRNVMQPRIFMT
jgi:hypothetical protein